MRRCPECYAIMRETSIANPILQRNDDHDEVASPDRVSRFECTQCGHMEEALATGSLTAKS